MGVGHPLVEKSNDLPVVSADGADGICIPRTPGCQHPPPPLLSPPPACVSADLSLPLSDRCGSPGSPPASSFTHVYVL